MRRRKSVFGVVTVALAVSVVTGPGSAVTAAVAAPAPAAPTDDVRLVTGDIVTLGGEFGVQVRAAEGREHVTFHIRHDEQGDTHVIPEDAIAPLVQGRLDPDLFDVSALTRVDYGDTLPLIIDHAGPVPRSAALRVTRDLPVLSAAAVEVDRTGRSWATVRAAKRVWLDAPMRMSLDQSVPQIGAPTAWAAGHTGAGAKVAVLDSGIDSTHPDLADAVVATEIFSDSTTIDDLDGHGTHIASTITGDGATYQGVAPDATLMVGKVFADSGWANTSWIIAGMEWAATNGADVVNMSLGSYDPSDGTDPVSLALNEITARTGTLFVVAAGNDGGASSITSPAAADAALAVGAVDRDDALADFSNTGPRAGDGALKPDITAPGVNIVAAKAVNGTSGRPAGDGYVSMSGTSMATPHVAGAAAILAAQHPDWSPEQLKAALMGTAEPNQALTVFQQGAGRVDVAAATAATVVPSVPSLSLGKAVWPHGDDQPVTRTLTYTNTGAEPVTLDLTTEVRGPRGEAAPAGMFTVAPASLTVPAGGQASATLTADTRVSAPDGVYTGAVLATGAGRTVRTPLTIHREVESHPVTVKVIGHDGSPTDLFDVRITNVDPEPYYQRTYRAHDPSGTVTLRLPKGEYFVDAVVLEQLNEEGDYRNAEFVEPAVVVAGATTLEFDARDGKPVELRTDQPNAKPGKGWVAFARETPLGQVGVQASGQNAAFENMTVRPSTTSSPQFRFAAEAHLAEWNGTSFDNSPYLYHLRHRQAGFVPTTLQWHKPDSELAKVRSEHVPTRAGTVGRRDYFLFFPLPGTLTEYYTPDVEWRYELEFVEWLPEDPVFSVAGSRQLTPLFFSRDRVTTMRWGQGVYGPSMPTVDYLRSEDIASREPDDRLYFLVPTMADQDPGRVGYSYPGTTQLLRGDTVIGEIDEAASGLFPVGPERATYTLRTTSEPTNAGLSTRISAEWTFTSEHVDELTTIPLLALRFAPRLNNRNAAPAGTWFTIPVYAQRNGATSPGTLNTPTVEVSYDDGATWRAAMVVPCRGQWTATVHHPRDAEFVSLRSSVTDAAGNSQRQTIIRAYALD